MKNKPSIEDLRNYGLPNSELTSIPVATPAPGKVNEEGCPNCKCKQLMEIKVEAKQNLLKSGKGIGTYLGCPACPYASPMLIINTVED